MSRIRKVEISNFRSVHSLIWQPKPGINCLVGPGDSGKSTILDAIDLCLGARRNIQFNDKDFHNLNVDVPIKIALTLGDLQDGFKALENYGLYLRAFDNATGEVISEPHSGLETVLTLQLVVTSDLEPLWSLYSPRAEAQNQTRTLSWADRIKLASTKLGALGDYHFSWRKGSVLNRLSDERASVGPELAKAGREARKSFGDTANDQVAETLIAVQNAAVQLGIPVGKLAALIDAQSLSLTGGTICLHGEGGVPLHCLGLGSTRLLITGLQKEAAKNSRVVVIDELEHGLEPHRVMRLIRSLGAKESPPPLQVFMTTHSPVAVCELSVSQLLVLRRRAQRHEVRVVGQDMQGTIRACPGSLLSVGVILGEGASEVGLLRGLDIYRSIDTFTAVSLAAQGVSLSDGNVSSTFGRANTLAQLGYKALVFCDNDHTAKSEEEKAFTEGGGTVLKWEDGHALEQALFSSLSDEGVLKLLAQAEENLDPKLVNEHIKSASNNALDLEKSRASVHLASTRQALGLAAKAKKASWFKSTTAMEHVGRTIVGPDLPTAKWEFREVIDKLFSWASDATTE